MCNSREVPKMPGKFSYEKERVNRLRKLMDENRIDVALIPPGPNFFYFTGFETESMERLTLLVVSRDEIAAISPKLMEEQMAANSWIENIISWNDEENPYRIAGNEISGLKPSLLAIDGGLPYFHYSRLFEKLRIKKTLGDPYFASLRMVKDSEEISRISEAVSRSEIALKSTLDSITDEITEKEVAAILEDNLLRKGLDSVAFTSIVASGENSSVPHHSRSDRKIGRYEPIVIDFGGRYHGYASDTTRTLFIDRAPPEFEEIYEITRSAQASPIEQLGTGSTYADADMIARGVIDSKGYGSRFIHRLGHGLGISVHEDPYLIPSNKNRIEDNAVFTIEPGIYLPGKGGVRIEDTVRFSHGQCIPFNSFSKDLTIL